MRPELCRQLEQSGNLPTLPSVAIQILDVCQAEHLDLAKIARVVSNDPALVTKLLKTANSPLFASHCEINSVKQAIELLGVNAVRTLVLSFSLADARRSMKSQGLAYVWRRSVLSAISARELAHHLDVNGDEAFICGLLQDIGVLALASCLGRSYFTLQRTARGDHDHLAELEREMLGSDHAEVGAWLLSKWAMPATFSRVVAASHNPDHAGLDDAPELRCMTRVMTVAGRFADLWSDDRLSCARADSDSLSKRLTVEINRQWPDVELDPARFAAQLVAVVHGVAPLFDITLNAEQRTRVLEGAKEALLNVSVRTSRELSRVQESIVLLESQAAILVAETQRDPLTQVANRGYTNTYLETTYRDARAGSSVLGAIFADIDNFKRINDSFGHLAGDAVLQSVARRITDTVRNTDFVGRFGGEEFMVVVRCERAEDIALIAERIRSAVAEGRHSLGNGQTLSVTISLGCAVLDRNRHSSCWDMIGEADRALYKAKYAGRNRVHVANVPQVVTTQPHPAGVLAPV